MEWRIIVPVVLCLIGILHVPGNAAQTNSNATVYQFSLTFSINDTFLTNYTDLTDNTTKALITNVTSQVETVYRTNYTNFLRFNISKFSNGSIVTTGELQFSNGTKPIASDLVQLLSKGNFTFTILVNSTNATDITPVATTPATTTVTTTTATTTASPPASVGKISLVFKIIQTFKANYANLTDPETKQLADNITTAFSQVYRKRYANFYRMIINKFSNGSIVTDSALEFNTTNSISPNATDVKDTLTAAIANGNFSFQVDNTSISVAVINSGLREYNLTFRMNQNFTSDLSNMSTDGATKLATNITSALDGFYKTFKDFSRTLVWQFRNGSIIVDALLGFFNSTSSSPSASALATSLADAVRNGTIKLAIDPKSINVTDPSGVFANRSPVLASMLTAVWMTLASLLLSAVMH